MSRSGGSARRWSFAGDVVAPAGQAAMDVICLYALLMGVRALAPDDVRLDLAFWFLAALILSVGWLGRLTLLLPWPDRWTRAALIPLTAMLALIWLHVALVPRSAWLSAWDTMLTAPQHLNPALAQPDILLTWGLMLTLWIRGLRIGLYPLDARELSYWLIGGIALFVVLAGLAPALPVGQMGNLMARLGTLALVYIALGLVEVALVHIKTVNPHYGVRQSVSVAWLLGVVLPIGLIFAAAFFVAYGLSPALRLVMVAAVFVARLVATATYWVLYVLMLIIAWLLSLLPRGHGVYHPSAWTDNMPGLGSDGPPLPKGPVGHPSMLAELIVFGLLLGAALYYFMRPRRRPEPVRFDEQRTTLFSWSLFWQQLRALLALLLRRIQGIWQKARAPAGSAMQAARPDLPEIRRLYREMLRLAAGRGQPRRASLTPREYARQLMAVPDFRRTSIEFLTSAYQLARYGEKAPDEDALRAARSAIETLITPTLGDTLPANGRK